MPARQRNDVGIGWMQDELGLIREACLRGGDVEAVWRLEKVQQGMTGTGKLSLEDIQNGRVHGPFSTADAAIAHLQSLARSRKKAARKSLQ